jgi:hypothetical protein
VRDARILEFMGNFIAGILLTLAAIGLWQFFSMTPSADNAWVEDQAKTVTAEVKGDTITLRNVRDWTYDTSGPLTKDWTDVTVDAKEVARVWFIIVPISDWKAIGHTFLSFEFTDGSTLAFSIEARREDGEDYQPFMGAFRSYELGYLWGTERDFIARRMVYQDHPLRMYPLVLPEGGEEALLRALVEETNELATAPRFYNTLTANCTNLLANIINERYPKTLPSHYSWVLTGYSDTYLMREGFIEIVDASESKTLERYDLTPHKESIGYAAVLDPIAFSDVIRLTLEAKE